MYCPCSRVARRTPLPGRVLDAICTRTALDRATANGEDHRPVVGDRQRQSSGAETTFAQDLTAPAEIEAGVRDMAENVWTWRSAGSLPTRQLHTWERFRLHLMSLAYHREPHFLRRGLAF